MKTHNKIPTFSNLSTKYLSTFDIIQFINIFFNARCKLKKCISKKSYGPQNPNLK